MYSCETELFKIELIICIKMDLALNNLQRLISYKTQPTIREYTVPYLVPDITFCLKQVLHERVVFQELGDQCCEEYSP